MDSFNEMWQLVYKQLQQNTSEAIFNVWFSELEPVSFDGNCATLLTTADFKRRIIVQKFYDTISDAFESVLGFKVDITKVKPLRISL